MVGASSSEDLISNIDLGNPLHLQNSDFSSSTSVKLTRTENYRVWVAAMKLAINTRNKTRFIDGTCIKSTYASSAPLSKKNLIEALPLLSLIANMTAMGHPNGTLAKIKYVGNLKLSKIVVLFDVLVVPEFASQQNHGDWHGHPSDQAVDVLHSDLNFSKDSQISLCDIYHMAKQTGEPFPFSDHHTTTIGELVHLDLWGPYKVISKDSPHTSDDNTSSEGNTCDIEDGFLTSMGDNTSFEGNVLNSSSLNTQWSLPENVSQVQLDVKNSSRSVQMPAKFNDYVVGSSRKYGLEKYVTYSNLSASNDCLSTTLNKSSEPNTYYEALKDSNWVEAMNNKIEALNRNNTWTICDLKVADLFRLDISNASLYGDLTEDIHMSLPLGFDNQKGKVCKLNKSLYGLKQAPRQWNAKLTMALIGNGFVRYKFDYSLFTEISGDVFVVLLVYVDDIVIIRINLCEIEKFKVYLKSKF
ncbi:ribonuclease H-like domain-containing protein [Tanacetum coccineum]|uniref:Ribonuclease H-like domain-containing protein n=1 Tax=Tanacetum coccineum TaxID=301880 RepID=A0ABQ5BLB6_9ASTR